MVELTIDSEDEFNGDSKKTEEKWKNKMKLKNISGNHSGNLFFPIILQTLVENQEIGDIVLSSCGS